MRKMTLGAIMRGSLVKKLRKEVNRKVVTELESFITVLRKERLIWRVIIAIRIIINWTPKDLRFGIKTGKEEQ